MGMCTVWQPNGETLTAETLSRMKVMKLYSEIHAR
jgi:hypothetical protein